MTTTAPSPQGARLSLYDRWASRVVTDPAIARRWRWLAPTLITLLAGVLRLWNLGHPHALVFDETYYAKDSWTQWNLGYPATWPEEADPRFLAGETDIFSTVGSFVVHPPLGRFLIGIGFGLFGPDTAVAWRVIAALVGTAVVLSVYLIARHLTGSTSFASVAGLLMAVDGLAIVLSRVALLDIFLTFFVLLAVWFVLLDRRTHLRRLEAAIDDAAARDPDADPSPWGPVFWNRPWVLAAGAAIGAATAVKWSGLYVAAALGVYLVVTDALARRRLGVAFWPLAAVVRQGVVAFLLFIPVAVAVYLASWIGWLTTEGGWDRSADPDASALQNLWTYHQAIYNFHVGLTAPHGYASPAWQWPLLLRPTSMYYQQQGDLVQNIYSMPNPLIWYAGVAAVIWLGYRFVVARDWRHAIVLVGVGATYLPWLLYPERTIFQFYTIATLPFLVLALTFALRAVAGAPGDSAYRRTSGQRVVGVFLVVALALSAFWYPILTGTPVPYSFWQLHNWMPGWI
ncbi:dolichyl-phosphate-mannose--protein mannosyltransferase [Microbacterium terricola]|uniref:Polyprenol-phosphate-mannose--protein mannosyltransferase n=1 Tax=Microbacterium terricola TaxID=344163 RepID=A0ABM8E055_9MICO|nr:phospholipid carrier-dependent glycosyltransferase [Microbacterium terricola]UYK41097.1 phospholipid carrier-dependent glycosyltransferase [Microbacterium terricola]BDV31141.1 phospholipid carrier-dependent glycosyltransferase [Microbacterium terricola]